MDRTLGRYTLHEELGRGAMSIIHRGYDPRIRRTVALKTLREEYRGREEYRSRFLLEARSSATLSHPGIVTILDVGIADGVPFIAMELMKGPTLASFVERHSPLPLRTVLRIVTQIADALDYAHRRGVVHQDIKPENIAVTSETGNVKVMDFGIARLLEEAEPQVSSHVAGTPNYMSPEQIRRGNVDGRSDLYSLGVLLYWLLAGHTPFTTNNVNELLRKVLNEPTPPLEPLDPATPDALLDVVRTLLARNPAERYQTGSKLIDDLNRIDDMLAERDGRSAGRRIIPIRVRWTMAMCSIVAVTVALGLTFVYQRHNEAMSRLAFDHGRTLARMLAIESAESLLLDDHVAIQVLVDEMVRDPEIVRLAVSDREGQEVASAGSPPGEPDGEPVSDAWRLLQHGAPGVHAFGGDEPRRSFFLFESPVQYQEHELGRVSVGLSADALIAANPMMVIVLAAVLLLALLAVFIGAYALSRRVFVPVEILRSALDQIARGHFDARIRTRRNDEFARAFAAYNAMADSLETRLFVDRSARRDRQHGEGSNVDPWVQASVNDTMLFEPDALATAEQERSGS